MRALYLSGVPVLTPAGRNEARRFVTLIDALYEARGVALHLSADAPLPELVQPLLDAAKGGGAATAAEGAEVAVDGLPDRWPEVCAVEAAGVNGGGEGGGGDGGGGGGGSGDGSAGGGKSSDAADSPSFAQAPVGGRYTVDGELSSFFTAVDEAFMARRTLSRLTEMCPNR